MQILRLRLQNFRQHENTEIEFGAGLTGIIGPNGAGKSTLLEAIAFALYGTPAARGTRDSIRRRGAPPRSPVRVELEFTLGPHRYQVNRGLNLAELYLDGDPSPLANSLGAVTDKVTRLLGMTREEFFNTYFTSQKELAVMAAMSAPERARFLSRVLGYERLRLAQDQLRITRSALKSKLDTLRHNMIDLADLEAEQNQAEHRQQVASESEAEGKAVLDRAVVALERSEPEWERLQQLRERVVSTDSERKLAEHKANTSRERFTSLDRRLAEALSSKDQIKTLAEQLEPLPALQQELAALDRQAEAHAARTGFLAQADEVRRTLASVNERLAQIPDDKAVQAPRAVAKQASEAHRVTVARAEEQRTVWVRDAQDAQTKRSTLGDQYRDLRAQRDRMLAAGAEGDCPTCGRALGADFEAVVELLDRQLQDVEFNGNFYKQRIEQLKSEPTELVETDRDRNARERAAGEAELDLRRLQDLLKKRPNLVHECKAAEERLEQLQTHLAESAGAYDEVRHREVRQQIESLEPVALQVERFRALSEQAEGLVGEAEQAEKELSQHEQTAAELARQLADLGFTDEAFTAAREVAEVDRRRKHEAEKLVIQAQAEVAAAGEAVAAVERRMAECARMERDIAIAHTDLTLHQELDRAFTDLRTDLNAALRPELSDLASAFIRDLTNDRYSDLELDEDYMAVLMEDGQPKPVVSGGEEDVANLALRLAISQMIAERAGQPLSLLVLDEIFGSLDEERRGAVLELLRSLADRFPQVVLITHIESVREGFDRVIRVEVDQDRGVSIVQDEAIPEDPGAAA
ncbi:MAG: SMC family ATPase [Gemmatimonadales bacterium]